MSDIDVLLVITDRDQCVRSAKQLEQADGGLEVAGATCASGVRRALRETHTDCIVFGENPLSADGSQLLQVVEAVETDGGAVPVILFADRSYGPSTARETDGIAGYVRSDGPGAYEHLADRIRWTVGGDGVGDVRYETLVESMDDGVLVLDEEFRIRYANRAMEDVFGVDCEEYVDRTLEALEGDDGPLPAEDVRRVRVAVESVLVGDAEDRSPEVTVDPPDGEVRVVELHVVALPGRSARGVLATVRNVTEYKRAESALRESRSKIERLHGVTDEMRGCRSEPELFELTVEAVDRFLEADVCGVDVVAGDEFVPQVTSGREYGSSPVEGIAGRAYRGGESILVDDASDLADASPVEGARSVLAVPIDTRGVLRLTAERPNAFDERDRDLAELLVAHVGESLTRIRVGQTLRDRRDDLIAERERLVALVENVPSPVVGYEFRDGEPVVRDANESFAETFDVDVDRALGDPLSEHVRPPDDADGRLEDVHEALRSGEGHTTAVRRETADGPREFLLHAGPLSDRDDEGFVIYTDVSEECGEDRRDDLEAFAEVAATDLRARLNEARGHLEVTQEAGDDEDYARVRRAHEAMSRLIDDLQFLSRPATDVEDPAPVSVEDAAMRAWAGVETGSLNLAIADATVEADPDRLEELIGQLLCNAVDHAAPGEDVLAGEVDDAPDLTVRVGPLEDGDGFYLEDTGDGIDPDDRDRVFEDGFSTGEDGAGLGLTVVERIVREHGWSVRVTDSQEGGARFEFVTGTLQKWIAVGQD